MIRRVIAYIKSIQNGVKPIYEFGPRQTKWLRALEGGEFKQTTGALRKGDAYCCLGVACEIGGFESKPSVNQNDAFYYDGNSGTLSDNVIEYYQFHGSNGDTDTPASIGKHDLVALSTLNDSNGFTLSQIATHVRKHPRLYFRKPV